MSHKKQVALSIISLTLFVFGISALVVGFGVTNTRPLEIKIEHLGTVENCELYRVKVGTPDSQLLWKCK